VAPLALCQRGFPLQQEISAMNAISPNSRDIEATIRTKLIELTRLSAEHGIDIEGLMHDALAICDAEPPFSR
jgi:hypothetical protein